MGDFSKAWRSGLFALVGGAGAILWFASADAAAAPGEVHEHGVAELSFAVEADQLSVEFHTPLANLIGFEHAPRSEAEMDAYLEALDVVRTGDLFEFHGTLCERSDVSLETPGFESASHAGDAHDHEARHDGHAELVARYAFACRDASRIERVTVRVFEHFEGFREITAIFLGTTTTAGELTAKRPTLETR